MAEVCAGATRALVSTLLCLLCLAIAAPGVFASEPDGPVRLRYEWVAPAADEGRPANASTAILRLHITAYVPLQDLSLRWATPNGARLIPGKMIGRVRLIAPDAAAIDELAKGESATLELTVHLPPSGGGLCAIGLDFTDDRGRARHDGIGVPIGRIGREPRIRNGAAEFPAGGADATPR